MVYVAMTIFVPGKKKKTVGRYLEIVAARPTVFDNENREWSEKIFKRLLH